MVRSGIRQIAQMRLPLFLTVGLAAFIAAMVTVGPVRDPVAASVLFTLLALPMTVLVFWAARYLQLRIRRARMATLREEDRRNGDYTVAVIRLCRSLVLGERRSSPGSATVSASTMRHIAHHIGAGMAQHGHLFSREGQLVAERVCNSALAVVSGRSCPDANFACILYGIGRLEGEMLGLDDPSLERRRMVAAGAEDPAPE